MSRRAAIVLAWTNPIGVIVAFGGGMVLSSLGDDPPGVDTALYLALTLALSLVAALVIARVPSNPIGWILWGVSLFSGLGTLADGYVHRYLAGEGGARDVAETAAWFSNWLWIPLVMVPLTFLLLLFPDGRLLTRRWRPVAWSAAGGIVCAFASTALDPGPIEDYPQIDNPYGTDHVVAEVIGIGTLVLLGAVIAAAASVVVRFRRARGVERQQLKWLAYAASLAAASLFSGFLVGALWSDDFATVLILGGVGSLPLAIGVAILRHRLYDIDVVINRTLVYGALTATLAASYLGLVLLLQLVLSPGSDLAVAGSTLAVAALFQPARARIQGAVDRRFYRRKYDAARTLEEFGARLRDEIELDRLGAELRAVVADTMQPAHVSLWVRER